MSINDGSLDFKSEMNSEAPIFNDYTLSKVMPCWEYFYPRDQKQKMRDWYKITKEIINLISQNLVTCVYNWS